MCYVLCDMCSCLCVLFAFCDMGLDACAFWEWNLMMLHWFCRLLNRGHTSLTDLEAVAPWPWEGSSLLGGTTPQAQISCMQV